MNKIAYREVTIQDILSRAHRVPYTVEYLAEELEYNRQDIAPYVSNLIEEGYLLKIVGVGMYRGRAITVFGANCKILQDPINWLFLATRLANEIIFDRLEHPNFPQSVFIFNKMLGAIKGMTWVPFGECDFCDFSFNNYIRRKTTGDNLSEFLFSKEE